MFKPNYSDQYQLNIPYSSTVSAESEVMLINKIVDKLNLTELKGKYSSLWQHAYHPKNLIKILFYGYRKGIRSSSVLAELCQKHNDFKFLSWNNPCSARTIRDFRKNNLENIKNYFVEILSLCIELGLTDPTKTNIDGSKFKANASIKQTKNQEGIDNELNKIQAIEEIIINELGKAMREEEQSKEKVIREIFTEKKLNILKMS